MLVEKNVPLQPYNTFGIVARAQALLRVGAEADLLALAADARWQAEPKRFEWKRGDFIYVPPFTIHQHFNSADSGCEARLIVISNRIVKAMGFDWLDQLENAPGA